MAGLKELRCEGINRKNKKCGQLLYKYQILETEMVVQIKCGSCNSFNILHLPFNKGFNNKQNYVKKNSD